MPAGVADEGENQPLDAADAAEAAARPRVAPPLNRLPAERVADFLELSLPLDALLRLARTSGVAPSGYRLEKLAAPELARLVAEAYAKDQRHHETIEDSAASVLASPALAAMWLTGAAARELAQLLSGDPVAAAARLAWRCLADGDPSVRAAAARAIDAGLAVLEDVEDEAEKGGRSAPAEAPQDEELRKRADRAERDREQARALLQQARAEVADRDKRLNGLKAELSALRVDHAEKVSELSRLHASRSSEERKGAHEVRKLIAERAHSDGRMAELEERLAAEKRRTAELAQTLANERETQRAPLNAPPGPEPEPESTTSDFAVPWLTPEFYASIERWDRRIVKTAFEKILLLARDRRHPSLRALPLEGTANYFRIRIASDVRLIYRRGADGRLDILSLIDREDLERYIRQAKTRPEP